MSNIFLLSANTQEDRFTSSLHYLIDNLPSIGQAIVDFLLAQAGKPSSRFIRVVDHPFCASADRPDFLLECEDYEILCEHKIASHLGEKQLERYLALQRNKPFYIALITRDRCYISPEVISTYNYLYPNCSSSTHYLWQDVYPIIAARPERLAREFTEYMRSLGMKPWHFQGWEELFINLETNAAFQEQWTEVRSYFKQLKAVCKSDGENKLGFQIQKPLPWLHLLYFNVSRCASGEKNFRIEEPYLYANIWLWENEPRLDLFRNVNITLSYAGGAIVTRSCIDTVATWNKSLKLVLTYYTSLAEVLSPDPRQVQQRLLNFAKTVLQHAESVDSIS